jgi:hypothetical protein
VKGVFFMKTKLLKMGGVVTSAVLMPLSAFAEAPDFTSLTSAIDFSTAVTAVLLVMAGLAGVYIVMAGGNLILSRLRRG